MAQQSAASTNNEPNLNKSGKQRPKPLQLSSSIPQHHISSSEPINNNSNLSPAERYIRSQMISDLDDSPPGNSSTTSSTISSITHAEIMHEWREKQANELYKKEPYRYKYGTPPSSSNNLTYHSINSQVADEFNPQTTNSSSFINQKKKK